MQEVWVVFVSVSPYSNHPFFLFGGHLPLCMTSVISIAIVSCYGGWSQEIVLLPSPSIQGIVRDLCLSTYSPWIRSRKCSHRKSAAFIRGSGTLWHPAVAAALSGALSFHLASRAPLPPFFSFPKPSRDSLSLLPSSKNLLLPKFTRTHFSCLQPRTLTSEQWLRGWFWT